MPPSTVLPAPARAQSVPSKGAPRHARVRSSWFDPLFPLSQQSRTPAWLIGVLYPLAVLFLAGVALLRQSGAPATNTIWAEDGAIFYEQSRLNGFLHTLTIPYHGYLQLEPRMFVQLTRLAPMADAAAVMAVTGACFVALVCCYVFHASRGVLPHVWSRLLLVAVLILLPLATGEILDNNVNIGWWFFFAAFWALITRPRTTTDAVLAALVCLLAIGTEPLVALLLPLTVVRVLVVRTDLRQEAPVIGLILGLAYQGIGLIFASGNSSTFAMASTRGVLQATGVRVGWGWLSGDDLSNHLISSSHTSVWQLTGYMVLVAVVGVAWLLHHRATLFFVVTAVGFAVITFVVPVYVRGAGPTLAAHPLLVGSRYSATPVLLIWSAVLVETVRLSAVNPRRVTRYVPALACLVILTPVWVLDFRPANLRTGGPRWSEQAAAAATACKAHPESHATLQISPAGWEVVLPCRDVS
jgi:hypothetical protein